jgi:rhodanese-related sulfurtransferase
MKKIIPTIMLILFITACQPQQVLEEISSVNEVSQVDFSNGKNVLLDVRTAVEYEEGYLPNAINMDVKSEDFDEKIKTLDPKKNYFLYCRSGNRSTTATDRMKAAGFKHVINLKDGYINYQKKE